MKEIFIAILTICLFNACSSDSVEELKEELVCDTCEVNVEDEVDEDLCEGIDCDTNLISFQSDIYPIINTHCISCHGGVSH